MFVYTLCVLLMVMSATTALADITPLETELTIPFTATIEDNFEGGVLIVTIKKEYSEPNKEWALSAFGNPEHVTSYVDLTATANVSEIAYYEANEFFRQVFEFYLDTFDKQTSLAVADEISLSQYVYSVSVNSVYDIPAQTTVSESSADDTMTRSLTPLPEIEIDDVYGMITEDPLINQQYNVFTTCDVAGNPLTGAYFLLGDGGGTGSVDSVINWIDFAMEYNSYMIAVDVNCDGYVNLNDKIRAQAYLDGTIKSLL